MTLLVAFRDSDNIVHCAADHAISSGVVHNNGRKLFKHLGLVVACAGSLAVQNIVEAAIKQETQITLSDDRLNLWFKLLREIVLELAKQCNGSTTNIEFICFLAMGSELVWMGNVGGWYRVAEDFRCTGTGEIPATAVMYALNDVDNVKHRFDLTFGATALVSSGVSSTYDYEHT